MLYKSVGLIFLDNDQHIVASNNQPWSWLVAADLTLLILLTWSFIYIDTGSASYVIAQISVAILLVTIVGLTAIIYIGWEPF